MTTLQRGGAAQSVFSLAAGVVVCLVLLSNGIAHEVPVGGLTGVALMSENGRPIAHASITLSRKDLVGGEPVRPKAFETDARGRFGAQILPAGEYVVEASAKAHSLNAVHIAVVAGKTTPVELEMTPNPSYLDLMKSQQVFTPDEAPELELHGFDPSPTIGVTLYRLDLDKILKAGGLSELLQSFSRWRNPKVDPGSVGFRLPPLVHKIANKDAEGAFVDVVSLPQLAEGFYFVECRLGAARANSFVNVSKIGLVTKSASNEELCFVADLKTGKPVPGATLAVDRQDALVPAGTTSSDGLATLTLPPSDPAQRRSSENRLVVARAGQSVAVVGFYGGREPTADASATVYMVTDRSVYRPGDHVDFKGFVRKRSGLNYGLPAAGTVDLELRDSSDSLTQTFHLPLSAAGSFDGSFDLNREAPTGVYQLTCRQFGGDFREYVEVADYRKPEFTIEVKSAKRFYTIGQKAQAIVQCKYYFGGPVVGAKVKAAIFRSVAQDKPDPSADDSQTEAGQSGYRGGDYEQDVDATTDAEGRAKIDFDTGDVPDAKGRTIAPPDVPVDYTYTVQADVTESGDKSFMGLGDVSVVQGDYSLGVASDQNFVAPGDRVDLEIKTTDHFANGPVGRRKVRVATGMRSWNGDRVEFHPTDAYSAETGDDGKARITVRAPKSGEFAIRAETVDDRGNTIQAEETVYVSGDAADGRPPSGKLEVTLDRTRYQVGEACNALIRTDKAGGYALMAIETDRIVHAEVVRLDNEATPKRLSVLRELAPNANVSVVGIRDKQFLQGDANLDVSLADHNLTVKITSDKALYAPGETATYTVQTTGPDGSPMPSEVSLAVVDESVFAIKDQTLRPLAEFYPTKSRSVQTNYSFAEIYLDGGDKGGANVTVRTKFVDTAFWAPSIQTNSQGLATVRVALPDNLTSWRATVVGVTPDAHAGVGKLNVRVSKPLTVRLQLPSYLVAGDTQEIVAIVNNDSESDRDVHVRLDVEGASVSGGLRQMIHVAAGRPESVAWTVSTAASGPLKVTVRVWTDDGLQDGMEKTVAIEPHGRRILSYWNGQVDQTSELHFNLRPDADPITGRVLLTVSPSIASSLFQSLDKLIDFPYGCVEQTMSRFLPTILVADLYRGKPFPRPDLLSRVPSLAADGMTRLQAMQHQDGGWGWWTYDESDEFMTAFVLDGLNRAKTAGFAPNPFVVERAINYAVARLKVQIDLPSEAKTFATKSDRSERIRDRAYLCYAAAVNGKTGEATAGLAKLDFTKSHAPALALGALAYHACGSQPECERLLLALKSSANIDDTTASWSEAPGAWGSEPTAQALTAIAAIHPEDPIVPKIVRYLMRTRNADGWTSTRDSCFALIGLTRYLAYTKELSGSTDLQIALNGALLQRVHIDGALVDSPNLRIEIPVSRMQTGDNVVTITRTPGSPVYVAADFVQVATARTLPIVVNDASLVVKRTYRLLAPQRMEDGTLRLMPSDRPISSAQPGDIVQCELTIVSNRTRSFMLIEDHPPTNCHVTERDVVGEGEEWDEWWSSTQIRDDKIAFFATGLPKGVSTIDYTMRAESPGLAHALPCTVTNMYDPSDSAATGEDDFEVSR